ncbi:MAG: hypothetical protein ACO1TE_00405 [Prosthecobacter sp.]
MKLNALLKTLGFLALAASPALAGTAPVKNPVAPVAPENDDLGINASIGYDTNYIWRGLNFGQHWVRAGIDGTILLVGGNGEDGAGSTSLNWDVQFGALAGDQDHFYPGGFGGAGTPGDASFQRLQLGAAIEHDLGPVQISAGYRYYRNMGQLASNFPLGVLNGMNDGQEVSLGLATALGPIDLSTSANYDFINHYWYFDATASSTIAVTDSFAIVPFASIGYGHNMNWQFANNSILAAPNNDITGWTSVYTGVRFPIKLNSRATLIPYVGVNLPLGATQNMSTNANAFNALPTNAYNAVVVGGVTLSVSF